MLTDLDLRPFGANARRLRPGVYLNRGESLRQVGEMFFHYGHLDFTTGYGFDERFDSNPVATAHRGFSNHLPFGTADSVEQVLDFFGDLLHGPDLLMIEVQNWPHRGCSDWRWHKNGPYIGDGTPEHECFRDETTFRKVVHFHIHRLNGLTWDDFVRLREEVRKYFDDTRDIPWDGMSPELQRSLTFFTRNFVSLMQQNRFPTAFTEADLDKVLANYLWRQGNLGKTRDAAEAREVLGGFIDCMVKAGFNWDRAWDGVPPFPQTQAA